MFIYSQAANDSDTVSRKVSKVLAQGKTKFQEYLFFDSTIHGTCIALDGDIQSCASDEALYHEALVHPAMLAHPNPKTVLIMGGGEGATAREVLRHTSVEHVIMVDIDREFVELCKQHIPSWGARAFSDPRLDLRFQDIDLYLETCRHTFDVVIGDLIDIQDWNSPAATLYSQGFYQRLQKHMSDNAILATQAGPLVAGQLDGHNHIRTTLLSSFEHVASYGHVIPSFYHLWGYTIASKNAFANEAPDIYKQYVHRAKERNLDLHATGIPALSSAFALPYSITNQLN